MQYKIVLVLLGLVMFLGCKKDPYVEETGYPDAIGDILTTKCATSGCHNQESYLLASELNLSSMASLLKGGHSGASVIPFAVNQSSLLQFINTYTELGLQSTPTMPLNADPLTFDEVTLFRNWILAGCPDRNGNIPFSANPQTRRKIYVSNQGCDLVSVIDAESKVIMRNITVGHDQNIIELPHMLQLAPDGKHWYACFVNGTFLQQYDAVTDKLTGEVNIGQGSWNVVRISSDSKTAFVSDLSPNGKLVIVDLTTLTVKSMLSEPGLLSNPHGIAVSNSGDTIYITANFGNMIYRYVPKQFSLEPISIQKGQNPVTIPFLLDPHEVSFDKDESHYFVTCQASNEVRVMDRKMDTLVAVIPVGKYPLEMAWNKDKSMIYVGCQEDVDQVNNFYRGSVYCINPTTYAVEHVIYANLFQPHGLIVDEEHNLLYIASRNADPSGPAPHHVSGCSGRNGYYTVIDLKTYKTVVEAFELSSDPYSVMYK
ncbi:MAG: hypothetical protein JNM95_06035 [Chitinophagaceae bacterium]|nr:hypothetical protein [Chitinophagaceae bacterium]